MAEHKNENHTYCPGGAVACSDPLQVIEAPRFLQQVTAVMLGEQ